MLGKPTAGASPLNLDRYVYMNSITDSSFSGNSVKRIFGDLSGAVVSHCSHLFHYLIGCLASFELSTPVPLLYFDSLICLD